MKTRSKKRFISLLAGTSILAAVGANVSCKVATKGYVGVVYDVGKDGIVREAEQTENDYSYLDDDSLEVLIQYPSFLRRILDIDIKMPIEGNMVPQGITIMNDYILITSYDHNGLDNSIVFVLDKNGDVINRVTLDIKSHVGGIAFDRINDLVWIPSNNGKINAYLARDFLDKTSVSSYYRDLDVGNGLLNYKAPWKNSIAFLTIKDNDLFVGSFSLVSSGLVKRYGINIDETNGVQLDLKNIFKVPTRVQGISFYNKDEKEYILFSRSFGKSTPSLLQIFSYDENIIYYNYEVSVSYEAPSMMEQISAEDNKLYVSFESAANPYKGCSDECDNVCIMDADLLVQKLK